LETSGSVATEVEKAEDDVPEEGLFVGGEALGDVLGEERGSGRVGGQARGEIEGSVAVLEPGGDLLEELLGALDVGVVVAVDVDEGASGDGGSVRDGIEKAKASMMHLVARPLPRRCGP
jgi:hypothetical protein